MKKKTYKIIICISLVVMLFTNFTSVFGATNPDYTPEKKVSETALDSKIKDSILLDALANMINAVASLAEYLIGAIFSALTGDNIFPWADRIIFNGIAFLDINFLNPDPSSLFGSTIEPSILGKVVRNVYSTIFSLAVLFLGVAVGVMAIRLAISSIAAEKAKYKQALVNWGTCMIMLFLMHYVLAFVFWINEQMVQVASGIFLQAVAKSGVSDIDYSLALSSAIDPETRRDIFLKSCNDYNGAKDYLESADVNIVENLLGSDEYQRNRMVYIADSSDEWQDNVGRFFGGEAENNQRGMLRLKSDVEAATKIKNNLESAQKSVEDNGYYVVKYVAKTNQIDFVNDTNVKVWRNMKKYKESDDYEDDLRRYLWSINCFNGQKDLFNWIRDYPNHKVDLEFSPNFWTAVVGESFSITTAVGGMGLISLGSKFVGMIGSNNLRSDLNNASLDQLIEWVGGENKANKIANYRLKCDGYIWNVGNGSTAQGKTQDLIANLGYFFKKTAYVYNTEKTTDENGKEVQEVTGWRASKLSVTGALLYAIFIFQSCMYLIMYVKRLFYVIMLSMFGPIVVIYDFFMKSAGG